MSRWPIALAAAIAMTAAAAGAPTMILTSSDIQNGSSIPQRFAAVPCGGQNAVPLLTWRDVPANAKALALTIVDPDAPRRGGFVHWFVARIPPGEDSTRDIGSARGVVIGTNSTGTAGYFGPCPPAGDKAHHYHITLYALDDDLPFTPTTPYADFKRAIRPHVVETAQLVASYQR